MSSLQNVNNLFQGESDRWPETKGAYETYSRLVTPAAQLGYFRYILYSVKITFCLSLYNFRDIIWVISKC
jgi:hypothetical protein